MAVSKQDRKDYEQGRRDAEHGTIRQAYDDTMVNHPSTPAYGRGRRGEQLDGDKGK